MTRLEIVAVTWLLTLAANRFGLDEIPRSDGNILASAKEDRPAKIADVNASDAAIHALGVIEGTVHYHADPKRPWKFVRYYVENPSQGALAEAVIALEGVAAPPSGWQHAPQVRTMDQLHFQFVPETMAVWTGDSVRITNSDDSLHNVMTTDGEKPFNENVAKGDEFTRTFNQPGGLKSPIRLGCVFHGGMRAWIFVFDHPWFAVTDRSGRFRFENVPPGEYTLALVHPAGRLRWSRRIDVKPSQTAKIDIPLTPDNQIGAN